MSVVYLFSGAVIAVGTPVVMSDPVNGECEAFDVNTHNIDEIVGVVYAKTDTSERIAVNNDGPIYYTNDYTLWTDELKVTYVPNPNYQNVDMVSSTDFVRVCVHGFAPVLKAFTSTIPSSWKKLSERTTHDWFVL